MVALKAQDYRQSSKEELVKKLDDAKQELASLRVKKVAGTGQFQHISIARKKIATILTVISQTQRSALREVAGKNKYLPTDLRFKKTRAQRRALTAHERRLKTLKQKKKLDNFPLRKYAVKA